MSDEAWKTAIELWRALPEEEKARRRWEIIPRRVAASMAAAGEPASLAMLEAEHAKKQMPMVRPRVSVIQSTELPTIQPGEHPLGLQNPELTKGPMSMNLQQRCFPEHSRSGLIEATCTAASTAARSRFSRAFPLWPH